MQTVPIPPDSGSLCQKETRDASDSSLIPELRCSVQKLLENHDPRTVPRRLMEAEKDCNNDAPFTVFHSMLAPDFRADLLFPDSCAYYS